MPGAQAALGGGLFLQRLSGAEERPRLQPRLRERGLWTGRGPQEVLDRPLQCRTPSRGPECKLPRPGPSFSFHEQSGWTGSGAKHRLPHPRHPAQEIGWKLQPPLLQKQGHGPHCLLRHSHHTPGGSCEAPWSHVPWWRFDDNKSDHSRFAPSQIRASLLLQKISLIPQQREESRLLLSPVR